MTLKFKVGTTNQKKKKTRGYPAHPTPPTKNTYFNYLHYDQNFLFFSESTKNSEISRSAENSHPCWLEPSEAA